MPYRPLELARSIERSLDEADAVVGLDSSGLLWTRSGRKWVRGIELRRGLGPSTPVAVEIEVVGGLEQPLPDAADQARRLINDQCRDAGVEVQRIDVTFTDIDDGGALDVDDDAQDEEG